MHFNNTSRLIYCTLERKFNLLITRYKGNIKVVDIYIIIDK